MLKVICVVDKEGTALDRLAKGVKLYNTNLNYKVIAVHPKRPDASQLAEFEKEAIDADIIDAQYFRTIEKLRTIFPWLKDKKTILTHNNPYSIEESDWNTYSKVVANNKTIYKRLSQITNAPLEYIPITLDAEFWTFNDNWEPNTNVIMVANRIESKKGVLPVALACKSLGINLQLVGAVSDQEYFLKVLETGVVRFHEQITDEKLKELYYKSSLHICNSVDNFESGTMPILEAMLCGVPVITRNIGHVPELDSGENMIIHKGSPEDVEAIATLIHDTLADKKKLVDLRDNGWNTAKSRSNERRAYMYQKLYRETLYPDQTAVSVVMPICGKPEIVRKCLDAVAKQTYKNIELVVCDDGTDADNEKIVKDFSQYVQFPVRYIRTANYTIDAEHLKGHKDYGLARARNIGTIESTGDIMVYVDQRQVPEENAVEEFIKYAKPRYWLYGNKGAENRPFVENFSCVYRDDVIRFGLFSERGTEYGFQSQYVRALIRNQGMKTEYCKSVRAVATGKSSNRSRKRQEILHSKNKLFKMNLE